MVLHNGIFWTRVSRELQFSFSFIAVLLPSTEQSKELIGRDDDDAEHEMSQNL